MIKYINGDILTENRSKDKGAIVCQQVNCLGVMGAGLAKQVREQLPRAYKDYVDKCNEVANNHDNLGTVQYTNYIDEYGYIVANCFGQYDFGRYGCHTDYEALKKCMIDIRERFLDFTVRIPYAMGCGLGGGDWNKVISIIQEELCDKGVDVEIWKLG